MGRKAGTYNYDEAFRAEAVALDIDQHLPISRVARNPAGFSCPIYRTIDVGFKPTECFESIVPLRSTTTTSPSVTNCRALPM